MMSSKGRQEISEKQIVNPPTLEQRIRADINRARQIRYYLDQVVVAKSDDRKHGLGSARYGIPK